MTSKETPRGRSCAKTAGQRPTPQGPPLGRLVTEQYRYTEAQLVKAGKVSAAPARPPAELEEQVTKEYIPLPRCTPLLRVREHAGPLRRLFSSKRLVLA